MAGDPKRHLFPLLDLSSCSQLVIDGMDDLADSAVGIDFGAARLRGEERAVEAFVASSEEVRGSIFLSDAGID